jgi:hypothetical protein
MSVERLLDDGSWENVGLPPALAILLDIALSPALANIISSVALRPSSGSRRRSSPFSSMRVEGVEEDALVSSVVADEIE